MPVQFPICVIKETRGTSGLSGVLLTISSYMVEPAAGTDGEFRRSDL